MEKNKNFLLEILAKKGLALCEGYNHLLEEDADSAASMKEEILNVYNEITKFTEVSDTKVKIFMTFGAIFVKILVFKSKFGFLGFLVKIF